MPDKNLKLVIKEELQGKSLDEVNAKLSALRRENGELARTNQIGTDTWNKNVTAIKMYSREANFAEQQARKLTGTHKSLSSSLLSTAKDLVAMGLQFEAARRTMKFFWESFQEGAKLEQLRGSFKGSADDLERLKTAAGGLVDDTQILQLSNVASGLNNSMEQQIKLWQASRMIARATGRDITEVFNGLIRGEEGMTRGLIASGISRARYNELITESVKRMGGEVEQIAGSQGTKELNIKNLDSETQSRVRQQVMLQVITEQYGDLNNIESTNYEKTQQLIVGVKELKEQFGLGLSIGVSQTANEISKLTSISGKNIDVLKILGQTAQVVGQVFAAGKFGITGWVIELFSLEAKLRDVTAGWMGLGNTITSTMKQFDALKSWTWGQKVPQGAYDVPLPPGYTPPMPKPTGTSGKTPKTKDEAVKEIKEIGKVSDEVIAQMVANTLNAAMTLIPETENKAAEVILNAEISNMQFLEAEWTEYWQKQQDQIMSNKEIFANASLDIMNSIAGIFQAFAAGNPDAFKSFLKTIGNLFINTVEAMIWASRGGSFAKAIMSFGASLITDVPWLIAATVALEAARGLIGGLESGTDDWGGGLAVVGEKGPELAYLPKHSAVINNRNFTSIVNQNRAFEAQQKLRAGDVYIRFDSDKGKAYKEGKRAYLKYKKAM